MQTLQSPPGTPSYASLQYVCSRITLYYSSVIDLRWSRSIHSCDVCPMRLGSGASTLCSAVHYGMCTPVRPGFRPAAPVVPPPVVTVVKDEPVAVLKNAAKVRRDMYGYHCIEVRRDMYGYRCMKLR